MTKAKKKAKIVLKFSHSNMTWCESATYDAMNGIKTQVKMQRIAYITKKRQFTDVT